MHDSTNGTINISETLDELASLEARRETLLETLRNAHHNIGQVLSAFAEDAPPAKKPAPKAAKRKAPKAEPAAAARTRAPNVTDEQIAAAVEAVRVGGVADAKALAAAKRKGLVVCSGRGRGATYSVAS